MRSGEGNRDNRIYIFITIVIIVLIFLTFFLSNREITQAYIDHSYLDESWKEDINLRQGQKGLFGLENWISFTYVNSDSNYPAYVSITTYKTLFMMSEDELLELTMDAINEASIGNDISFDENKTISGVRTNSKEHKTKYMIFEGVQLSTNSSDIVRIIGETWNCGKSGTSIICIGFAQITDNLNNNSEENISYWSKIIRDKDGTFINYYNNTDFFMKNDGLLYNVICH